MTNKPKRKAKMDRVRVLIEIKKINAKVVWKKPKKNLTVCT